ncbi:MAG TPA: condensation domain-containing protein, partial [Thermoanaerobaculia bacterium]
MRRHEALRTVFAAREGLPVQVIQPAAPFLLPVVDLSGLPDRTDPSDLVREEAGRPFDLSRDPLLRGVLLRFTENDHVAALTMHHIASDGWSLGILVREVTTLYADLSASRPSPLPEMPVQYADFAVWQRSWLHGETLEQEIAFWRRQLAGLPPVLELPIDRPRPAVQSFRGGSRPVSIPAGLTRSLEALARREGATLFMVLLAGFQSLLSRLSGQEDFAVGTPVAGRNRVETEGLIGFFVNTLVLRGNVTGKPSFRELLGRVRETALAAYMHQDVPFERLVEDLAPERSLAHTPLFQVMFALQNFPYERVHLPGLSITSSLRDSATAKFELGLTFMEAGGELGARLDFAADLFDAATILRVASHLTALLAAGTADPGRSLRDLPLLSDGERHQLRVEWNDTSVPAAPGVIEVFMAQALRLPEAVAVTDAGGSFTYRALDRRSNFLAQRLRALGAGPGVPVGLCVERTADLVVAALAIFKSGGAWLSLDPSHPPGRLAFLLEDAAVPLLVV